MNYVTRKAFEAKVKQIGNDLGLGNVFNESSSSQQEQDSHPQHPTNSDGDDDLFPVQASSYFDAMPNNFPPLVNLFYIDITILSEDVKKTFIWAHRVFMTIEVLLLVNALSAIIQTIITKGRVWVRILLSFSVGLVITFFQLFNYDTAFRGAYRTNRRLRIRYVYLSIITAALCAVYAFTGALWFNGWTRIPQYRHVKKSTDESSSQATSPGLAGIILSIIEASGWVIALFLVTFTLFDFYHLWRNDVQGLNNHALQIVRTATHSGLRQDVQHEGSASNDESNYRHDSTRSDRIEQIRNKYSARS